MPRTKQQNETIRSQKRQLIVETALALFASDGYAHTSISRIAHEAGISKGLLYNYFESKEALLLAILEEGVQSVWAGRLTENMTPEDFLRYIGDIFALVDGHRDFYRLYTALSTQPGVAHLLSGFAQGDYSEGLRHLYAFFVRQFGPEEAMREMLFMSALAKGAAILSMYGKSQNVLQIGMLRGTIMDYYKEKFGIKS